MEIDKEEDYTVLRLGVFNGCITDLDLIDFSRLNLRLINGNAENVKNIIETNFKDSKDIKDRFSKIRNIIGGHFDKMQVILPIDFSKPVYESDIYLADNILKILFPYSDVSLHFYEVFIVKNGKASFNSSRQFEFKQSGYADENYLKTNSNEFVNINAFIKLFLENFTKIQYYKDVLEPYLGSFYQNFKMMEYISLCISLESIIEGNQELNYRIKRNLAILIGRDIERSNIIFKNVGKVYELRSKIVHSSKYSNDSLEEYLPYLRNLVSLLLIELILQNINNLSSLNKILTETGFGSKKNISESYIDLDVNSKTYYNVVNTILK